MPKISNVFATNQVQNTSNALQLRFHMRIQTKVARRACQRERAPRVLRLRQPRAWRIIFLANPAKCAEKDLSGLHAGSVSKGAALTCIYFTSRSTTWSTLYVYTCRKIATRRRVFILTLNCLCRCGTRIELFLHVALTFARLL